MADFYIAKGDTTSPLRTVLKSPSGSVINLSGATVKFQMKAPHLKVPKIFTDASIIDADNGVVEYQWAEGDTDYPGTYFVKWIITYQNGLIQTVPNKTPNTVNITNI